jgi:hypothetical protein
VAERVGVPLGDPDGLAVGDDVGLIVHVAVIDSGGVRVGDTSVLVGEAVIDTIVRVGVQVGVDVAVVVRVPVRDVVAVLVVVDVVVCVGVLLGVPDCVDHADGTVYATSTEGWLYAFWTPPGAVPSAPMAKEPVTAPPVA